MIQNFFTQNQLLKITKSLQFLNVMVLCWSFNDPVWYPRIMCFKKTDLNFKPCILSSSSTKWCAFQEI